MLATAIPTRFGGHQFLIPSGDASSRFLPNYW
jgi:hypothetical protein